MPPNRHLDYDVSVTADKRRRMRARGMTGAFESSERACDWPGCDGKGAYRAPASPERLDEFRWFCLDHVRDYNAAWNFFEGLDESALEERLRNATVWERPTWRMGNGPAAAMGYLHTHADGRAWERFGMSDPLDVLGAAATINPARSAAEERPRRRLTREEQKAMDTLGLPHQVETRVEVRRRYRALVKDLHPDMNGGSNPEPERLARVLKAWQILRKSRNFRD
ncbi:J domain-containing protein [Limibaculum sp. FT325]|uniref:J domain-containing protein n=1 Tax=Thermohalobaculum sediminis TaxID=2939436 RepID=UPI0020BE0270|nr:J domain-containing protein [Limibaculum sediminis]MCL5777585.1 J domain-containing protein [Limibaculum sediminis]